MSGKYYSRARFVLLFVFLVMLLLLRKPDLLSNPQLYAEDATIFFRDQLLTPRSAVFYPYNGQFHLVPRLIALMEGVLPLAAAAVVCSMASILVHALCLSIFFLPWNRWLVANDLLRAGVCVVMATALDGTEMIGFSGPLMWYLFLAGMLILFRPEPGQPYSARRRWIQVAAMFVIAMSVAPMVILIPAAVWLLVKARGDRRFVAAALLAGLAVQCFALRYSERSDHPAVAAHGLLRLGWEVATGTVVSWIYPGVVTPLAGRNAAVALSQYPSIGPPLFVVIGLAMLLTWLLTIAAPKERLRLAIALYVALSTVASVLYTRNLLPFSQILNGNAPLLPARYFVLSGAALVYMVCLLIERLPLRDARLQPVCLLLIFAAGIAGNFSQAASVNFPWSAAAPQVEAWRAARAQGHPKAVAVPIAPPPWSIYLP
jgi:hypothetical protein